MLQYSAMSEGNFKKDFFDDTSNRDKSWKTSFIGEYIERRSVPHIRIPIEYTVVTAIAVLVMIIISYSVGVERGKRIPRMLKAERINYQVIVTEVDAEDRTTDEVLLEEVKTEGIKYETNIDEKPVSNVTASVPKVKSTEEKPLSEGDFKYVIQLASFKDKQLARAETKKLRNKKIEALFSKKGSWHSVYAGYQTRREALRALRKLEDEYSDCFIRKVK